MKCAAVLLLVTLVASAQWAKGRPPLLIYKPAPEYTGEARQVHLEGEVLLRAAIGVDGIARDILVTKPLGRGLDGKAIECVRNIGMYRLSRKTEPRLPCGLTSPFNFG